MPHIHLLVILDKNDKINDEDIDKIISSEIPCHRTHPKLFNIVTRCMMHGPCGSINPNASCMKNGKCSKNFPKKFVDKTTVDTNGKVIYKRINNGKTTIGM